MPQLHNEGDVTRNYISYNFQTLRDDVFMLARDGSVTGNRRSGRRDRRAPIHVSSYNGNRESNLRSAANDFRRRNERHRL